MSDTPKPLVARLPSLTLSALAGATAALVAVGTVLLHMTGAVMHVRYLSYWGIDADLFPKSTEWTLLHGYYGLFERGVTVLRAVWAQLLTSLAALIGVALYFAALLSPLDFGAGATARFIDKLPERLRGFARRFVMSMMLFLFLLGLVLLLVVVMGTLGAVGETAGRSMAERNAEDFKKGCTQSRSQCVELRRDGTALLKGYVLDSSESHIAIFDVELRQARALPRDGVEMVTTRSPW